MYFDLIITSVVIAYIHKPHAGIWSRQAFQNFDANIIHNRNLSNQTFDM